MSNLSRVLLASVLTLSLGTAAASIAATPSSLPGAGGNKIAKTAKPKIGGFKAQNSTKHPPSCTAGENGDSKCITYLCDASGVCVENGSYCVSGQTGKRIPC